MHEKHKGHEAMHLEMILILLVTLIIAQIALVEWKKRHYRSYSVSVIYIYMSIVTIAFGFVLIATSETVYNQLKK